MRANLAPRAQIELARGERLGVAATDAVDEGDRADEVVELRQRGDLDLAVALVPLLEEDVLEHLDVRNTMEEKNALVREVNWRS